MPIPIGPYCVRYTPEEVAAMWQRGEVKPWHAGHEAGRPATVIRPLPTNHDRSLEARNERLRQARARKVLEGGTP
jgi:hypothetical protein